MRKINFNECEHHILFKTLRIVRITAFLLFAVILQTFANADLEQQRTITGKVTDTNGEPLPGATVVVKGTTVGITTNFDGNYSLQVPEDAEILSFSFVGMKTQEIALSGQTEINVVLEEESIGLDEVVAIGYGVQKKSNVTGAISSVKSEDLANRSTSNVANALQGKAAGVQVMNTSGAPGASSAIRIRGIASNETSDPLYVVDGLKVPDIDYLDPDNVESIEILKDAASAAIYGAEAGNGVVLITTKSGKPGDGKFFYNGLHSFNSVANKTDLLNAEEFINFYTEINPSAAERMLNTFYYNDPSSYVNNKLADTDWQDAIYESGYRQRHTIGFQGGNDKGTMYLALNHLNSDGIIIGSQDTYSRITGQFNGTYKIKDWLDIGANTTLIKSELKEVTESDVSRSNAVSMAYTAEPILPVEYSDGLAGASQKIKNLVADGRYPLIDPRTGNYFSISNINEGGSINPLATVFRDNAYTDKFMFSGSVYANLKPVKNLIFTSRLGYRFSNSYNNVYTPPYYFSAGTSSDVPNLEVTQTSVAYYQWENFANYLLTLGESTFSATAGMSYSNNSIYLVSASTDNLSNTAENFHYLDYSISNANDDVEGNKSESAQIAYFGRVGWDYGNKYNLQFNFRGDSYDASRLDLENNWGYFPSISAGWTFSNESFMQNVNRDLLSFGKLRASYGKNGSMSNLNDYMYASTLSTGNNAYLIDKLYTGVYPSSYLANPKLRWEESVQLDVGLDIRQFNDRLSFSVDYYNKNTEGLLVLSTALLTTGTSYQWQNVGVINNQGFEFDLEWKDKIAKELKYGIRVNIGTVKNEVTEYKGEGTRLSGASLAHSQIGAITYFEEGYPIWYLRGYKVAGIDHTGAPVYENMDSDPAITDKDRTMIGDPIPNFNYGVTFTLDYKNFDFLIFGTGVQGGDIMYGLLRDMAFMTNRPQFMYNGRWTAENNQNANGVIATSPSAIYQINDSKYINSDAMVFDGSYFKIKQIQLGYNVPASLVKKIGVSSLRAYVSMEDFFTFTKYPGTDPETRAGIGSSMALDFGGYPISKSVTLGINLTF